MFNEIDKESLLVSITIILVTLIVVLGLGIICSISEKRNIEKELKLKEMDITLKEMEIYGEIKEK